MINKNNLVNNISEDFPDNYNFDSKIIRLQSTLFATIKLINVFKKLIDKNYMPLTLKNINCNNVDSYSSWQRVSMCYQKELCKNKEYSTLLKSFQTNNSGFDERLSDKKKEYRHDFINSINLGIGVFGLSCYIYLNK